MQPILSKNVVAPFSLVLDSALHRMTDNLLGAAYVLSEKTGEHFPHILQELLITHCSKASANQSLALTQKELQDLAFLQSFGDSLLLWIFKFNNGIKNQKSNDGERAQVTLADPEDPEDSEDSEDSDRIAIGQWYDRDIGKVQIAESEDSDPIAMALQIGIEKLGHPARQVLRSRYSKLSGFPGEIPVDIEKRWGKRLKHIGALRRIYEEVEHDLSLDPLAESSLTLPILFTCIELGELLIRNDYIPSNAWICNDPEIQLLLGLIPKLLHFLPEEELQIGRFKLIGKIGEGGYGIVYKGYDEKLRREVAIKMPRISEDDKSETKQIAIREARASARLDHPGILPLLDIIEMPNQTILVSPFIKGASLSSWLKNKTTRVHERVAALWALNITHAMIHAHSRGVLHCDLKPGNILLEILGDDCLENDFVPKVADFGLAKLTLAVTTTVTGSGVGLGTPMYMAPEQTMGRGSLSVACDIYGVGGILYQLLANHAPFQATTMGELMKEVMEKPPIPLKTYRKDIHPDLDAICMKCMEKNPSLRYLTMNDLNADLKRFLQGEPTLARPLGTISHALRWCKKHALLVTLLGIIFSSLSVSTIVFMFLLQKVTIQAKDNLIQKELSDAASKRNLRDRMLSDRQFYSSEMRSIQTAYKDGEFTSVMDRLNGLTPVDMGGEELRGFEWHYWTRLCSQAHQKAAALDDYSMRYSLNGNKHAAISLKKSESISIVDINTTKEIKFIPGAQEPTYSTNNATLAFVTSDNVIHWVDAVTFKELGFIRNEGKTVRLLFLDENRLLVMQQLIWKVIDISSASIIWEKPSETPSEIKIFQLNLCRLDNDRFVTWGNDGRIQIWNVALKIKVDDFPCEGRLCQICESSNDAKRIAWTAYPSKIIVRDIESKKNLVSKDLKDIFTFAMAWSPDDKQIALGGWQQTIDIINSENGVRIERRTGHSLRNIRQIKWPIGGKLSSMACQMIPEKSELLFWDEKRVASSRVIYTLQKSALGFVLDAKSKVALLLEESKDISLISVPEGKLLKRVKFPDFSIASASHPFDPYFIVILDNREIWKVDHQGNTTKFPIRCPSPPSGAIIISSKGDKFAIGLNAAEFDKVSNSLVNIYNIKSGELIATHSGALSSFTTLENLPKSDSFISSQRTGALVEINWQDGTLIKEYIKAPSDITFTEMSPRFDEICLIKGLRNLQVMNFPTMSNARDFRTFETNPLRGLKWTEDSTRLFGWGMDGTIQFWDAITGQELLKLNAHEGQVLSVTELPGGRKILSLGKDNQLKLWDATPIN